MAAHNSYLATSDALLYSVLILGFVLEYVFPTEVPLMRSEMLWLGWGILALSWTILIIAKLQFKTFKQSSEPGDETTMLVETGIFKYSRNPMYVGVLGIPLALGLIINSVWVTLSVLFLFVLVRQILVMPEESYLAKKFGDSYSSYKKRIPRWLFF